MKQDDKDGKEYINIYSQGKTWIGRELTNFSYSPIETEDGKFNSIEGYWYWLNSNSNEKEKLRDLIGFEAKKFGRSLKAKDWNDTEEFKDKIKKAIEIKIRNNKKLFFEFKQSYLPFVHHYIYGDKIVNVPESKWIINFLEQLRNKIKMNNYNFKLAGCDTDSILFHKSDQTPFTEEEQKNLIEEINNLFPKRIRWEHDGIYPKVVVVKTKNYLLYDGKKTKIKGSALKATTKCPALKQLIKDILQAILDDKNNFKEIYDNYAKEILDIKDMSRWCSRVTITDKMLKNTRKNEVVKRDALAGSEYREGDRCYMFYKSDNTMSLLENFNGDYNIDRLLENLYTTMEVFSPIMDMTQFPNYKLKKNKPLLEELRRK